MTITDPKLNTGTIDTIVPITGYPGSTKRVSLGKFVLDEPTEFTRHYETAAWWAKILVPAGEYELNTNGYWVLCSLAGVITAEHTPSLFAGVSIGRGQPQGERHRDVGRPTTHGIQSHLYEMAKRVAHEGRSFEWGAGRVVVDPDVSTLCSFHRSHRDPAETITHYSLGRPE